MAELKRPGVSRFDLSTTPHPQKGVLSFPRWSDFPLLLLGEALPFL